MLKRLLKYLGLISLTCSTLYTQATPLKVGIEDIDYYPHLSFGYRKNSFAEVVLKRFFAEHGIDVVFVPLPVKRFNDWFLTKEVDFKYPDNAAWRETEKHDIGIIYSQPLVSSVSGTIRPREHLGKAASEIHLLGTMIGFHPKMWFQKIQNGDVTLLEESNPLTIVQLPLRGIVDAIEIDYSVVHFYLSQVGKQGQLLMDPSLPHEQVSFSLSTIEHGDIVDAFNQFIDDNQEYLGSLKEKVGIIDDPLAFTQSLIAQ